MNAQVDVHLAPHGYEGLRPEYWSERVAVVLDVLRATSTMVTALGEGYAWVLPCAEMEIAREQAQLLPKAILAGERGGLAPVGFSKGNSPREFLGKVPSGCGIILTTSNGTRAIEAARGSKQCLVASYLNFTSTVEYLQTQTSPITLVCSGTGEAFSLEDAMLASALLRKLQPAHPWAALDRAYGHDLAAAFASSVNGRRLRQLGLKEDLAWCLQRDRYSVVVGLNPEKGWMEVLHPDARLS
ncbi:MAG: 2-phosphosulfolactate phosphatase [Blastochloris sp.]|jgi:2-phosphosulfolactate phosphatase|nr:2-phosphosulfolactate phosphatase [Blastochloris sp.]